MTPREQLDFICKLLTKDRFPQLPEDASDTVVEFEVCPSCGCAHYSDVPCSKFPTAGGM